MRNDDIRDWGEFRTHDSYLPGVRAKHGRKHSFWKKYEALDDGQ